MGEPERKPLNLLTDVDTDLLIVEPTRRYNRGTSTLQATVLRLDPDMHAAVKARAEVEERTMAQVMRRALRAYLATEVR